MDTLKDEYMRLAHKYADKFNDFLYATEYGDSFNCEYYCIGDDFDGIWEFGDYYVDYKTMRFVIDSNMLYYDFDEWYNYCVDVGMIDSRIKTPTVQEWFDGNHGMSKDELDVLKKSKEDLLNHIDEFKKLVKDKTGYELNLCMSEIDGLL